MINSGREWDWMDDKQQQHDLEGWGFDLERLKTTERGGGGASLSPPKVPRANITTFIRPYLTLPLHHIWPYTSIAWF